MHGELCAASSAAMLQDFRSGIGNRVPVGGLVSVAACFGLLVRQRGSARPRPGGRTLRAARQRSLNIWNVARIGMLRVSVELWPEGQKKGSTVLAVADIERIRSGVRSDYSVDLFEDVGYRRWSGTVDSYPRWSASVWDLVARSIASALSGSEALPKRPTPVVAPIHRFDGVSFVRLREIPQPARRHFEQSIQGKTRPVISGVSDPCACGWDWFDFING